MSVSSKVFSLIEFVGRSTSLDAVLGNSIDGVGGMSLSMSVNSVGDA